MLVHAMAALSPANGLIASKANNMTLKEWQEYAKEKNIDWVPFNNAKQILKNLQALEDDAIVKEGGGKFSISSPTRMLGVSSFKQSPVSSA